MSRKCTLPALFNVREWFEKKFGDLCEAHDHAYVVKDISKWQADMDFCKGMWGRGYRLLSMICFFFFWTIGIIYWYT